jgi:hypothetical protein
VAAIFTQWRSNSKPRSRIPGHLWQAAVDLAPFYSIHQIAEALRLNCTASSSIESVQALELPAKPSPACRLWWITVSQSHDEFEICTSGLALQPLEHLFKTEPPPASHTLLGILKTAPTRKTFAQRTLTEETLYAPSLLALERLRGLNWSSAKRYCAHGKDQNSMGSLHRP